MDALRLASDKKKKTKVLRGETAKKVVARVSEKKETKKDRSQAERRKAMYGAKE